MWFHVNVFTYYFKGKFQPTRSSVQLKISQKCFWNLAVLPQHIAWGHLLLPLWTFLYLLREFNKSIAKILTFISVLIIYSDSSENWHDINDKITTYNHLFTCNLIYWYHQKINFVFVSVNIIVIIRNFVFLAVVGNIAVLPWIIVVFSGFNHMIIYID